MGGGRRLNIAHVHTAMSGSGGDRVSELESVCLSRGGHKVTIVGPVIATIEPRLRDAHVGIYAVPAGQRDAKAASRDLGTLDVVHCHCMSSAPFAADLAKMSGASLFLHNHNMGEEWECVAKRSWLSPTRRRRRKHIDAAIASAHRILCVSNPVIAHMRGLGLRTEKCMVIPNPIGDEFFAPAAAAEDRYDVCVIARASKQKRPFTSLRIMAEAKQINPKLRFVWVGRIGHWRTFLRALAAPLGLQDLEFVGAVQPGAVRSILDSSKVLLSASKYEGQPLAVIEALVRGCSAVLSDIPAHKASFSEMDGVVFFAQTNIGAAARLLVKAVDEHVRTPRTWLEAEHSSQAHCRRIEDAYFEALCPKESADIRFET